MNLASKTKKSLLMYNARHVLAIFYLPHQLNIVNICSFF